jgi:hypothetical protein
LGLEDASDLHVQVGGAGAEARAGVGRRAACRQPLAREALHEDRGVDEEAFIDASEKPGGSPPGDLRPRRGEAPGGPSLMKASIASAQSGRGMRADDMMIEGRPGRADVAPAAGVANPFLPRAALLI